MRPRNTQGFHLIPRDGAVLGLKRPAGWGDIAQHVLGHDLLLTSGACRGIRLQHMRGGDEPLLWIPDAVLGSINSAYQGEKEYWSRLQDKVVLKRSTPESLKE